MKVGGGIGLSISLEALLKYFDCFCACNNCCPLRSTGHPAIASGTKMVSLSLITSWYPLSPPHALGVATKYGAFSLFTIKHSRWGQFYCIVCCFAMLTFQCCVNFQLHTFVLLALLESRSKFIEFQPCEPYHEPCQ